MSVAYETSFTMRGATGVILQRHETLHLPRKMTVMIDPRHIWNVIYNERSNRNHNPSSPNTAPATQKWMPSVIRVTYETSFRMRGASKVNLEPHQILRLPRKMHPMINPRHTWSVIYNARSKHSQPPTSPNTAPATKSVSSRLQRKLRELIPPIERRFDDNPTTIRSENRISHPPLRRPYSSDLEHDFVSKNTTFRAPAISQNVTKCCACHEKSHSNFTKYCACHAKWISWLIRVTYETSFRMRGASKVNLEPHQILRLPRKMNLMIDPRLIWNVISNAQSKQSQQILRLPRKMNPMINPRHTWNVIYNARSMHSQPPTSPNTAPATKSVSSRLQRKLRELLPPIERRFDDNPIRKSHLAPAASETLLVRPWTRFCIEKYNISRSGYLPKCHQMLRLPRKVTLQLHQILRLARKMHPTLLYSILSWHLFSLGIYSLYASILPRHLFSLGIYSLLASILSRHLFSLGVYSL